MVKVRIALVGQKAGGRMHIASQASEGDPVLLVPEPDNPHDPDAVAVYTAPRSLVPWLDAGDRKILMDRQTGYISRHLAARLDLPSEGVFGRVVNVRWLPFEVATEHTVAGFDIEVEVDL